MPVINAADTEFHLSHEEEDKLNQFQAITDFPEEDLSMIIKLLRNHSWNLEAALSRYFDGNWKDNMGDVATPPPIPPHPENSNPELVTRIPPTLNELDTVIPSMSTNNSSSQLFETRNLVPTLPIIYKLPIDYRNKFQLVGLDNGKKQFVTHNKELIHTNNNNIFYLLLLFIPHSVIKIFSFVCSILSKVFSGNSRPGNVKVNKPKIFRLPKYPTHDENIIDLDYLITNKYNDNLSKEDESKSITLTNVKEIIGEPNERLSFNECLDICENEFKFLLVILLGNVKKSELNESEDEKSNIVTNDSIDINSKKFLNYVLGDDGVMKILSDRKDELIVYTGSVSEIEPWLVAKNLHVKYTPECFLIGNVLNANGSVNGTTKLSLLTKLKITSPRRLQNSLKITFDRYSPELVVSRTEREDLRIAREIKQLQEQAYQESLLKDQLKEEQKQLKLQELKNKELKEVNRQNQLRLNETIKNLNWLSQCIEILKRDLSGIEEKFTTKGEYTTLQFRTSEGTRFVRKFIKETTLHSIYVNIGCHLYLKNNSLDTDQWAKSICSKIQELRSDDSVLCFKDSDIVSNEINSLGLEKLVTEEIVKWKAHSDNNTDLEIDFNFELVSPFPRYKVPSKSDVTVKEISQLWPNGSLLVEDIMEEDTDDEENDSENEE